MAHSPSLSTLNRRIAPFLPLFPLDSLTFLTRIGTQNRTTVTNKRSMVATTVSVSDITGQEDAFTLDRHGFQLCRHDVKSQCAKEGYGNEKLIEEEYYPVMEQLLKDVLVS